MLYRFSFAALALALIAAPQAQASADLGGSVSITVNTFDSNPERGEGVFFRGPLTNESGVTEFVYVYFVVERPDGSTFKKNLGGLFLDDGQTVNYRDIPGQKKKNFVAIPDDAPGGTYTVTLFAATDRFGTTVFDTDSFQFEIAPMTLATSAAAPTASSLEIAAPVAAPNPFRDATEIRYTLAEDAEVDLRVYSVTGREVASLVSGSQAAGTHAAALRAGDLPGGTYIWRLAIGGEVTTGRVTLAR
ncbi:MAG: T9SS type A sorting domain-containing protein [Bacteroidota bacterium]